MTNATVSESVVGNDGHTLLVKYKDGEKKVFVPDDTPVVTIVPGDKSDLKAGAKVIAFMKQLPNGAIETNRGSIESVDGISLAIKSREGTDVMVRMTDNVAVFAVVKTSLSEIMEGSYIGVTAMPEPDGTQKAIAVHIFPENQRGAAEGFRPWDARANSTMTNATVAQTVKGTDGQNITVKYKDGEKKVVVPPDPPIVTFVASDKSV